MSNERLLVVDDEPAIAAFIRRIAQRLDIQVEVTSNAHAFKETYRRFDPTIIALDIVMPEHDGIELIQWLGTMRCTARILIISGYDPSYTEAAEILGKVAGLTSISRLRKPFRVADLERALAPV